MDKLDDDWEIGIFTSVTTASSSSSSTTKAPASFRPPFDNNITDVEESYEEDCNDDEDHDDDDDEDEKCGLACPFCSEDFDVLGLCCHIDVEHHKEAMSGVCPVCVATVETNMAVHLITQHETVLKILCKKKFRNGGSRPALSSLKKELWDEHLHSPHKGSSRVNSLSAVEPDSVLLPFLYNPHPSPKREVVNHPVEASPSYGKLQDSNLERDITISSLHDKGEEKVQRCEFIHGLLFSTMFGDQL